MIHTTDPTKLMYTAGIGVATYYAVKGALSDRNAMMAAAAAAAYYHFS